MRGDDPAHGQAADWLTEWFARNTPAHLYVELDEASPDVPEAAHLIPPGFLADVRKLGAFMIVPDELLEPSQPCAPLPWRWRLRNKISDIRAQAAKHAYKLIAGYDPPAGDDR